LQTKLISGSFILPGCTVKIIRVVHERAEVITDLADKAPLIPRRILAVFTPDDLRLFFQQGKGIINHRQTTIPLG